MSQASNMELRVRLMRLIVSAIERRGLKQREAADLFGTTQPRISEIVRGKVTEFTLDSLVNMLARAEIVAPIDWGASPTAVTPGETSDPVTEAYKKDVDRTLIRDALQRTPTERVLRLAALQRLADEARGSRARSRRDR